MKKFMNLVLLGMLVTSSMLLVSCSDDETSNGDTVSAWDYLNGDYDSAIMAVGFSYEKEETMQLIMIMPEEFFGNSTVPVMHDYQLFIDDVEYVVTTNAYTSAGMAEAMLNEGQTYDIQYSIDGDEFQGTLTIVYQPSDPFPETFDPTQSYSLSWTMGQNAQVQIIEGMSYYEDPVTFEGEDDFKTEELAASDRSFTIPVNWLDDFGGLADNYWLTLYEMNYNVNDDAFFGSYSSVDGDYYLYMNEEIKAEKQKERILKLIEFTK